MPQTRTHIAGLLEGAGLRPQKRHGQHFLIDLNLMRLLVDQAAPGPGDVVLEIGCGTGSLTELLSERAGRVVAVDIDPKIIEVAKAELAGRDNVTFLLADILRGKNRLNPEVMIPLVQLAAGRRLLLISNLPYGAGSPAVANLLHLREPAVAGMWVTVQREVADRLTAAPGGKDWGPLSVAVQSVARVKMFRKIPPEAFWPRPEVDSAMVEILPDESLRAAIADPVRFDRIVEGVFTQRRKTLRAAVRAIRDPQLEGFDWAAAFAAAGVSDELRPDHLSLTALRAISNHVTGVLGPAAAEPGKS